MTRKQRIGHAILGLFGWRALGAMPPVPKALAIGAPHTSNWDFIIMLPFALAIGAKITWLGKDSLFRWPFGGLMRWLGGLPVQRGARLNAVEQAIERFRQAETLYLVMSPEGTRRKTDNWKSGFYHIARGANVPVVLGYLDYPSKTAAIGPSIDLTGDVEADMARIAAFYADKRGRIPENFSTPRLLPPSSANVTGG